MHSRFFDITKNIFVQKYNYEFCGNNILQTTWLVTNPNVQNKYGKRYHAVTLKNILKQSMDAFLINAASRICDAYWGKGASAWVRNFAIILSWMTSIKYVLWVSAGRRAYWGKLKKKKTRVIVTLLMSVPHVLSEILNGASHPSRTRSFSSSCQIKITKTGWEGLRGDWGHVVSGRVI